MKNDYLLVLGASIMDIFGFSTSIEHIILHQGR